MAYRTAQITVFVLQLLLALFFLFVGGMKTAAPMAMLQLHHAWVASLPVAVARLVGISELLCAATMILGLCWRGAFWWSGMAAWALFVNQMVAVIFHALRGEIAISGAQNLLIIGALACVAVFRCVRWHSCVSRAD